MKFNLFKSIRGLFERNAAESNPLIESPENIIRKLLSDKRYNHSISVAKMCVKLSERYKLDAESAKKAYTAGILHDIMKEPEKHELQRMVEQSGFDIDSVERHEPKLWHAIAGASYVKDVLGINDSDIINAIRFHTTARANMSIVEKVVNIADWISDDREFTGLEELRELAFENLDSALYSAVKMSIAKNLKKNTKIAKNTFDAYNYYCEKVSL